MNARSTRRALGLAAFAALGAMPSFALLPRQAPPAQDASVIAEQAYVFGYPLVLMDVSRAVMTATMAPANAFHHMRAFPDASFTDVVSPNADTLYSSAWLDLAAEPIVLSVPDTHGRYYLMPMLDGWTNVFASPGKRTTGTEKGAFAVCGPKWKGALPSDVKELRAPTEMVWIVGRTQTNGKADYAAVHAIQDQYKLTPLSRWGKQGADATPEPASAKGEKKAPPVDQVAAMTGVEFFSRLASLMAANPPAAADAPMVEALDKIGVRAGYPFKPGATRVIDVARGVKAAREKLAAAAARPPEKLTNGWTVLLDLGSYGTRYAERALVALLGLGANLAADAIYPMARVDADGKPFTGAQKYVIHFDKGQTPPVNAFWSVTMYDDKQCFVKNPIDRYAIGDRDALKPNADGSIDLYLQHASPGADKESQWLPAPEGSFNVILRMYWPKPEALSGAWKPPGVRRVQ